MIRVLIIEDENLAANKLERLLGKVTQPISIVTRLSSLAEAIPYLSRHLDQIDLIFLDIQLGDGKCFEIFEQLPIETPIIFTTAYDQYAIQAFQQNSVDYLLKPVTQEALEQSIRKFQRLFANRQASSAIDYEKLSELFRPPADYKKRFLVYVGSKIRSIPIEEIAFFYSEQGDTFLTTTQGNSYDINYTLEKLTQILDEETFFRANRKFIVHIQSILEAYQFSRSKLKLKLAPPPKFDVFVPLDRIAAFKAWAGK